MQFDAKKPSYLSDSYWARLSQADQALHLLVNPMPEAAYTVDWPLNMLEKSLASAREGVEGLGGSFELNPDFQRGHVWTDSQRTAYAEAFIRKAVTGRILFNCPGWSKAYLEGDIPQQTFQCVDGLQRLTTMRMFLAGEVQVFGGMRAADLKGSPFDPTRMGYQLQIGIYEFSQRQELLDFYLRLNEGGTPHSPEELDRVRRLLEEARSQSARQKETPASTEAPQASHNENDWVSVSPHEMKSAGLDQVLSALRAGGSLTELQTSFYSGGYSYTHVLTTKRGAQYRVSKQVLRGVPAAAVSGGAQP